MCEVRPAKAVRILLRKSRHPSDRVTNGAWGVGKNLCPSSRGARSWFDRRCELMFDPPLKIGGRLHKHAKSHVGVRIAAELSALSIIFPRHVSYQGNLVLLPRDNVAFAADLRHKKAVNHIFGKQLKMNRLTGRNMNFIRGLYAQCGIMKLPPPLMSNHLDRKCVFGP